MRSKSAVLNWVLWVPRPWVFSLVLHLFLLSGVLITGGFFSGRKSSQVDFEVIENAVEASRPLSIQAPIKPKVEKTETKRAVFGLSRKALTSSDGVEVKEGNTFAKKNDDAKLSAEDSDALPIPTDEYLVSAMPQVLSEVRAPYPDEARRKGIEGAVVMELLIDQEGKVREAKLIEGPGMGLNEAALQAIYGFKFRPARIEDRPVAVKIRYRYRFILER